MRYYSKVTDKGNSSYSDDSQDDAEAKAKWLDDHGCSRCSYCSYCSGCSYCSYCSGCSDCSYCSGCSDCSYCSRCSRCSYCWRCSDCSGDVIQAGMPDGWRCYGHKKDGQLLIVAGCRKKTLAEARAYWTGKNDRREVLAAVEYIATVAALKGWPT